MRSSGPLNKYQPCPLSSPIEFLISDTFTKGSMTYSTISFSRRPLSGSFASESDDMRMSFATAWAVEAGGSIFASMRRDILRDGVCEMRIDLPHFFQRP